MADEAEVGVAKASKDLNKFFGGGRTKRMVRQEAKLLTQMQQQVKAKVKTEQQGEGDEEGTTMVFKSKGAIAAQAKRITMEKVRVKKMAQAERQFKRKQAKAKLGAAKQGSTARLDDLLDSDDENENENEKRNVDSIISSSCSQDVDADQVLLVVQNKWEKQKARLAAKAEQVLQFDEEEVGRRYDES